MFVVLIVIAVNMIVLDIPWAYGFLMSVLISEILSLVEDEIYHGYKKAVQHWILATLVMVINIFVQAQFLFGIGVGLGIYGFLYLKVEEKNFVID
jgi:hypothetical protein